MSIRPDRNVLVTPDWNIITNKPASFPSMSHDHPMSDIDGLDAMATAMQEAIPDKLSELQDDIGVMRVGDEISYQILTNKPNLFTGAYAALTGKPSLAPVALSGSYTDLSDKPILVTLPALSPVATSGLYSDLLGKPTIPTVTYPVISVNTKTGAITLSNTDVGAAAAVHTHTIANVTGLQTALDSKLNSASAKRQETYSGVTDASGNFTMTFAAFAVAPNIQVQIVNGTHNNSARVAAVSTTGFTVAVGTRAGLTVLGLTVLGFDVPATAGVSVDVLVTSK